MNNTDLFLPLQMLYTIYNNMPLKVFRIVLISFIFLCCKCQNSKEKSENLIPPCANKTVLKTFKNEPGFIRGGNHPSVDALFYYYFEPLVHYNEIPEILIFKAVGGGFDAGDHNLEQYYGASKFVILLKTDLNFYYICSQFQNIFFREL